MDQQLLFWLVVLLMLNLGVNTAHLLVTLLRKNGSGQMSPEYWKLAFREIVGDLVDNALRPIKQGMWAIADKLNVSLPFARVND